MKISFYTTTYADHPEHYGSRTADLAGMTEKELQTFPFELNGESFYGTYEECLDFVKSKDSREIQAILSISDDPWEENLFLKKLSQLVTCPIVGGGAARNGGVPGDGLAERKRQVGLFLVMDPTLSVETETVNIHDHIVETCELELEDARTVLTINGQDAVEYLREKKADAGFLEADFEHMTLSTMEGINAHLSIRDGKVRSGRDLAKTMLLRYVDADKAHQKIVDFYQNADENCIVFGCAGLGGLLEERFSCRALGTFLYGETCTTDQVRDFGNLMLSKIRFLSKENQN